MGWQRRCACRGRGEGLVLGFQGQAVTRDVYMHDLSFLPSLVMMLMMSVTLPRLMIAVRVAIVLAEFRRGFRPSTV